MSKQQRFSTLFLFVCLLTWCANGSSTNTINIGIKGGNTPPVRDDEPAVSTAPSQSPSTSPSQAPTTTTTTTPTLPPTPPPTPAPKKNDNTAGKIILYIGISILAILIVGVCWMKRWEIRQSVKNTWTTFRRYGCKGCILSLCRRRGDQRSSAHEPLNQIIFDPEDQYDEWA
mmetsp:Transcript_137/g.151  ORF Transcript_137/g.151 Transcript_137/m.151 type:complete len:172 (-) Transcript_137:588-1103(-)